MKNGHARCHFQGVEPTARCAATREWESGRARFSRPPTFRPRSASVKPVWFDAHERASIADSASIRKSADSPLLQSKHAGERSVRYLLPCHGPSGCCWSVFDTCRRVLSLFLLQLFSFSQRH